MLVGVQEFGLCAFILGLLKELQRGLDSLGVEELGINPDNVAVSVLVSDAILAEASVYFRNRIVGNFVGVAARAPYHAVDPSEG